MRYDIKLKIEYKYDSPAKASRTLLRMLPRATPEQQLLSGMVFTNPPPGFRVDGVDFFGNATTEVAHDMPLGEIEFCFEGSVARFDPPQALDFSTPLPNLCDEVAAIASVGPDAPHHFLGPSTRVPADAEIAEFAHALMPGGINALDAVRKVAATLHGEFDFDPDATHVTTTPIEAFRARRGVCQDISHVMISALRSLGIPACYVSGFLRTVPPEGQPRLEGADAMHAWVRAWCGKERGWIEIDPTNNIDVGRDHVVVAIGRDYADVAPVRGSLRSEGAHDTKHSVDVLPHDG